MMTLETVANAFLAMGCTDVEHHDGPQVMGLSGVHEGEPFTYALRGAEAGPATLAKILAAGQAHFLKPTVEEEAAALEAGDTETAARISDERMAEEDRIDAIANG